MKIFLDHASATPMDSRVKREILNAMKFFGNSSSVHSFGVDANSLLQYSRIRIGKILECRPDELVFTGSGTESNNLAIFGTKKHQHIITTSIEHHSVLRPIQELERDGVEVIYLPVNKNGIVDPMGVKNALREDTTLVSIIYANNEIGTVQPISEIAKIIREHKKNNIKSPIVFHIDACQASGSLDINTQHLGVDLMTINSAKIYGPKGIGALFVRRGTRISPIIFGGDQERGLRAGTQNPTLASGFAKALEIAEKSREKESDKIGKMRDWLIEKILSSIPNSHLNGDPVNRLPNNVNVSFEGVDGEMLMLRLDKQGIAVSTGSACTVTSNEPSHVLRALTPPNPLLNLRGGAVAGESGNIRITLGRTTTKKELEKLIKVLPKEVEFLRGMRS